MTKQEIPNVAKSWMSTSCCWEAAVRILDQSWRKMDVKLMMMTIMMMMTMTMTTTTTTTTTTMTMMMMMMIIIVHQLESGEMCEVPGLRNDRRLD